MLKRPSKKQMSSEEQAQITSASAQQTGKVVIPKTYDNDFPVFDIPVNKKVLVYIPNHTVVGADGSVNMRMDSFHAHPIREGKSFGNVRCTMGITSESLNLDGQTCPLCDGISECYDLFNLEWTALCKSQGLDPDSEDTKASLKETRKEMFQNFAIQSPVQWHTFPIVVIDCEEKDGQPTSTPMKNAEGQITGTVMWYSTRHNAYADKWLAGLEVVEDEDGNVPTSPAGLWAILTYTYESKNGTYTKMDSARNLKVQYKNMEKYDSYRAYIDHLTEEWTPEKAQEVVVLDVLRDLDETQEVADTLLKPVREKIALAKVASANANNSAVSANQEASSALEGFGATAIEEKTADECISGELPNVGTED